MISKELRDQILYNNWGSYNRCPGWSLEPNRHDLDSKIQLGNRLRSAARKIIDMSRLGCYKNEVKTDLKRYPMHNLDAATHFMRIL